LIFAFAEKVVRELHRPTIPSDMTDGLLYDGCEFRHNWRQLAASSTAWACPSSEGFRTGRGREIQFFAAKHLNERDPPFGSSRGTRRRVAGYAQREKGLRERAA
jgi:hypothetical protein